MPPFIQAIVCMVDFSDFSTWVIRRGAILAQRSGLRLYLVHAVNDPQDGLHPTTVFERGGDLDQLTDEAHRRCRQLMADTPIDWQAVVRFGDPVEVTLAFIDNLSSCLVISASHGVTRFRRLFIGTVVERLTRALKHPMLVIKPTAEEKSSRQTGYRRAVVGCDVEGHWQRMLPLLALLQCRDLPRIHLMHAIERPTDGQMPDADNQAYGQAQQGLQDRLAHRLRQQGQRHVTHTDRISVTVVPGDPQQMALGLVGEMPADLIAVGVRRSGRVGRWIAGSTTELLLRHAPCSVLTVPELAESPLPHGALQ